MSYATARAQLVSIVEDVTPTNKTLFAQGFKHIAEGATNENPPPRSFYFEAGVDGDMSIDGPFTPSLSAQPRINVTMTLVVAYRDFPNRRGDFDESLVADFVDVSKALLNVANWNRPTSGIHKLTSGEPYMATRRVFPRPGVVEQRTVFELWAN